MAEMDETLPFELVGANEQRASFFRPRPNDPQSRNPGPKSDIRRARPKRLLRAMSRRSRRISGPDVHAPAGVGPFADIGSAPACGGIGRQTRGRLQRLYRIAVKIAIFSDKHCRNSPAVSRPSRRALRIVLAAPSDMLRLR